jgi:hypothetical protein
MAVGPPETSLEQELSTFCLLCSNVFGLGGDIYSPSLNKQMLNDMIATMRIRVTLDADNEAFIRSTLVKELNCILELDFFLSTRAFVSTE